MCVGQASEGLIHVEIVSVLAELVIAVLETLVCNRHIPARCFVAADDSGFAMDLPTAIEPI